MPRSTYGVSCYISHRGDISWSPLNGYFVRNRFVIGFRSTNRNARSAEIKPRERVVVKDIHSCSKVIRLFFNHKMLYLFFIYQLKYFQALINVFSIYVPDLVQFLKFGEISTQIHMSHTNEILHLPQRIRDCIKIQLCVVRSWDKCLGCIAPTPKSVTLWDASATTAK